MERGRALEQPPCEGRSAWHARGRIRLKHFGRDRSGATAVEFGLVSVPFLGLLAAIFQTCLAFLMQQGLKSAVENAARQVLVGTAQNDASVTTSQQFRSKYVCPSTGSVLPSFVTCANIVVDVRPYSTFSQLSKSNVSQSFLTDGSGTQYNTGSPCQIVVVRAVYPMPVYLPIPSGIASSPTNNAGLTMYNGQLVQMLTAAAVFRNEPYVVNGQPAASGGC